jgi:hypothetical protein
MPVITEPVPIEDDFCMGLAMIEDLGANVRFVLTSDQTCFEASNQKVCVVKRKIVIPWEAFPQMRAVMGEFLARRALMLGHGRLVRLVR